MLRDGWVCPATKGPVSQGKASLFHGMDRLALPLRLQAGEEDSLDRVKG
jgi:hypothetical protein